jgi:GH43 family beta-xylosidase
MKYVTQRFGNCISTEQLRSICGPNRTPAHSFYHDLIRSLTFRFALRAGLHFICLALLLVQVRAQEVPAEKPAREAPPARTLAEIPTRDPFIFADAKSRTYYLVSSMQRPQGLGYGVSVFSSKDLDGWRGPISVFDLSKDSWAQGQIWAPEMHAYQGMYYLFTTFNADIGPTDQWPKDMPRVRRGTVILFADSPLGPFKQFQNQSHTPTNELALDGTFWVEDGAPYMVYCHEWVQIMDGTINYLRLKPDLSDAAGRPEVMFKGSDAPWIPKNSKRFVTDGPFLYRTRTGKLVMIWSSYIGNTYATGVAVSDSGKLKGPWKQKPEPLFAEDGGHGMIFKKFDGTLMLVLHRPNSGGRERAHLFELEDTGDSIRIKRPVVSGRANIKRYGFLPAEYAAFCANSEGNGEFPGNRN